MAKSARNILVFIVVVAAWIALDQWTKSLFTGLNPGDSLGNALGGLLQFVLVHNTGAAWGIFSGNPVALGVFSAVVVAVLAVYFLVHARDMSLVQTLGIALISAGGIGNAIDRFVQGYVTDFLAVTFIDFPVFNVADIGVTCGVVVLAIGLVASWRVEDAGSGEAGERSATSEDGNHDAEGGKS